MWVRPPPHRKVRRLMVGHPRKAHQHSTHDRLSVSLVSHLILLSYTLRGYERHDAMGQYHRWAPMKYSKIYWYYMYSPNKIIRRYLSRIIYRWADKKYGVKARGNVHNEFSPKQKEMMTKWTYWMDVKNKINKSWLDRIAEKILL